MNIFHLDLDPRMSAQFHCDKHVVKMCTEYCQILSSVCHFFNLDTDGLYKKTHINHPCVVWARQSRNNYEYLLNLIIELFDEYTYRYGKVHAASRTIPKLIDNLQTIPIGENKLTPFVSVLPGMIMQSTSENAIKKYRDLYMNEKRHITSWKHRSIPLWFTEGI